GNACTTDSCDPAKGCVYTPVAGSCDDYSVCTVNDKCTSGRCQGTPITCDDGNFCTDNLCDPTDGCWFRNNALICDDGNACTFMDQCGGGACVGFNYFTDPVTKAATLVFGQMPARAGSGLDVDDNPATCSPKNLADPDLNCGDGVDNAFANLSLLIKTQFGPQLLTAVESGALALLIEHEVPGPGAVPYELNVHYGQRTLPLTCDPTKAGCNYKVFADTLIGTCAPRFTFPNATLVGNKLTAGGKEQEAIVYLVIGTTRVPLTLKWADRASLPLLDGLARITSDAARIVGITKAGHLSVGARADVCVFDPAAHVTITRENLRSQGKNTPFLGRELQGEVR
ncbi:MAG TPA: amidohydrolase family protein, partial [Myxococcota bacterium]|nr:amidohydrolase family protein [Myxococcota bacterium]